MWSGSLVELKLVNAFNARIQRWCFSRVLKQIFRSCEFNMKNAINESGECEV